MKCPYCATTIKLPVEETAGAEKLKEDYPFYNSDAPLYDVAYGYCPDCDMPIVLLRTGNANQLDVNYGIPPTTEEVIYPRYSARPIDKSVTEKYAKDFKEAVSIMNLSPKASAAISRRVLQNILRDELGVRRSDLSKEIDEFISRPGVPDTLTEEVDAIRNIGNFAAHPLKDTNTGEIIEVEVGEAEWLIEVLESLFEFVFVDPKKLEDRKKKLNEKLASAGKPPMKNPKKPKS